MRPLYGTISFLHPSSLRTPNFPLMLRYVVSRWARPKFGQCLTLWLSFYSWYLIMLGCILTDCTKCFLIAWFCRRIELIKTMNRIVEQLWSYSQYLGMFYGNIPYRIVEQLWSYSQYLSMFYGNIPLIPMPQQAFVLHYPFCKNT